MPRKIYSLLGDPEMIASARNLRAAIDRDGRGIPAVAEAAGITTKRLELFSTDIGPMYTTELRATCRVLNVGVLDILQQPESVR